MRPEAEASGYLIVLQWREPKQGSFTTFRMTRVWGM